MVAQSRQAMKIYNKFVLKKKKEHMNTESGLGFRTAFDSVVKETEILSTLNHPNVIKLIEIIDDPAADKLYLSTPIRNLIHSIGTR